MQLRTIHLSFALRAKAPKRYGANCFKVSPAEALLLKHSGWTYLGHGRFDEYVAPPEPASDGLYVVAVQVPTDAEILALAMRMHESRKRQRQRVEGFMAGYRPAGEVVVEITESTLFVPGAMGVKLKPPPPMNREFSEFTFGIEAPWRIDLIWDRGDEEPPTWQRHEKRVIESKAALIEKIEKQETAEKRARAEALAEHAAALVVGAILLNSWGYNQTNINYYEIVERHGMIVVIRQIEARTIPGSEGLMCDWRTPVPGNFIGPPIRKRIGPSGLIMEPGGHAVVIQPTDKHRCSWDS